ncbi:MAG: PD-(D/E)XK nuclease family transposase [Synergistaceae bacterium]|nr:PD-(D/E)XK nuclease family transposase [Synergistaceae bacterium]
MKQDITKLKYYDQIQKMSLMDDELMAKCFAGHKECVELIIRVILGRDDLRVRSFQVQKTLKGLGRSVILDIYAVDTKGRKYNIEFQRADKGASPERARFNASMIDVCSLKPGQEFKELPEVYVIFITENDVLGYGLPLYTIDSTIKENGKPFKSGSHIVYVNCEHHDAETALGKLVHDFLCRDSRDEYYYDVIAERIRYLKEDQEGVREMGGVMEELLREQQIKQDKKHEAALKAQQKSLQKSFAERMIEGGELALAKIAEYSGLSLATVRRLAKKLEPSLS